MCVSSATPPCEAWQRARETPRLQRAKTCVDRPPRFARVRRTIDCAAASRGLQCGRQEGRTTDRLESWKAIAAYLQRDVTTVRRWEKREGLPVHRHLHQKQGSVYAFPSEIEGWRTQGARTPAAPPRSRCLFMALLVTGLCVLLAGARGDNLVRHRVAAAAAREATPPNLDARRQYLLGRRSMDTRTRAGLARALEHFHQAIEIDPAYERAWVGLADTHTLTAYYRFAEPDGAYAKARSAAFKAAALDPALAEARVALAAVEELAWNWTAVERHYQEAISLDPEYALARHWYANFLSLMARHDEAVAQATRAVELDPLSPSIASALANVYLQSGDYDRAIAQLRKTLEVTPDFANARQALGVAYWRKGVRARALEEMMAAARGGDQVAWRGTRAELYASMGRNDQARALLAELEASTATSAVTRARVHLALGDREAALVLLAEAVAARDGDLRALRIDPAFAPLRGDARFQALLRTMRFSR